jgi:hypothetical protein
MKGVLRVGRGNSGEESRSRGGGIGCAKGGGTLRTKAGTRDGSNSAGHRGCSELARPSFGEQKLSTAGQN